MMQDVIVVGAGAAGLACAQKLSQTKKVVVLEARNRIGGRVHTNRDKGVVEIGAEFVHGEDAVTWEIIKATNLQTEEWQYRSDVAGHHRVFARDGSIRPDSERLYQEMVKTEAGLYDYKGNDISVSEYLQKQAISKEALFFAERHIGDLEAADPHLLSARAIGAEGQLATNGARNFWITDGYGRLIEVLAKGTDIRFEHEVTKIEWREGEVTVTCRNQNTFTAKAVVVTLPLGVMKKAPPEFIPALPVHFTEAVSKIGFGNSTKLIVWLKDLNGVPPFRMRDSEGLFGHFWPRLFSEVPVLVGFSGATRADELTAIGKEAAVVAGIDELANALGSGIKDKIAKAEHFTWSDDPFAYGSYSYSPLGMGQAREDFRPPIANTIFYTGEATNTRGHTATVHGAIEAGRETADELVKILV